MKDCCPNGCWFHTSHLLGLSPAVPAPPGLQSARSSRTPDPHQHHLQQEILPLISWRSVPVLSFWYVLWKEFCKLFKYSIWISTVNPFHPHDFVYNTVCFRIQTTHPTTSVPGPAYPIDTALSWNAYICKMDTITTVNSTMDTVICYLVCRVTREHLE